MKTILCLIHVSSWKKNGAINSFKDFAFKLCISTKTNHIGWALSSKLILRVDVRIGTLEYIIS